MAHDLLPQGLKLDLSLDLPADAAAQDGLLPAELAGILGAAETADAGFAPGAEAEAFGAALFDGASGSVGEFSPSAPAFGGGIEDWTVTAGLAETGLGAQMEGCGCPMCSQDRDFGSTEIADYDPDFAPGPAGSIATLALYLRNGYWTDTGRTARYFNMGTTGTGANSGVLYYNISGNGYDADGLSAARQTLAREAFEFYEEVLGINFVETTSTADHVDFFFTDNDSGAYNSTTVHSGTGGPINSNRINVAASWQSGTSNPNDYTLQTFIHEIGHGLGLGHQGNYNAGVGTPTYANSAIWANDSWQQSIMSYWSQTENTSITASFAYLISAMAADFYALDALYSGYGYGVANAFNGNTVYGVGTNITGTPYQFLSSWADDNAFCIVDGSGTDTLNFSNFSANQRIDLTIASAGSTTGTISNVGGLIGNMTLAVGTVIENAYGGSGNDTIIGNTAANVLGGDAGNDILYGDGATDTLYGGAGNDTLYGGSGNDYVYGGNDNDYMVYIDGEGYDNFYGGSGTDSVWIQTFSADDLIVNLATGRWGYGTDGDRYDISSVETLWTGNNDDLVTGSGSDNYLSTASGNDTVYGGGGEDTLYGGNDNDLLLGGFVTDYVYGGAGNDTIRVLEGEFYDNSYGGDGTDLLDHSASTYVGTVFDFETGTITGTGVNNPAGISGIETYWDGSGGNTIISDGNSNTFFGGGGDDTMVAEIGGEFMYGGSGTDLIDLSRWNGPYIFDMSTGSSNYGSELYQFFENALLGGGNDSVTGTVDNNVITLGGGNDSVDAGAGNDSVYGGTGNDVFTDTQGMASADDDIYDGGDGIDTLIHDLNWVSSVHFDLAAGWSIFSGNRDQLISIENLTIGGSAQITGSAVANLLTVNGTGANLIDSGDGNDTVNAGGGNDTVYGGGGLDNLDGGDGDDILGGSFGNDSLYGGIGNDTLYGADQRDLLYGGDDADALYGGLGFDTVYGDAGADLLSGDAGNDQLWAGDGDDTIYGGDNNDTMGGGEGNDLLGGGAGADLGYGAAGQDTLNGGGGADELYAGSGTDTVDGGIGSDQVWGGGDADLVMGGSEADTVGGGTGDDLLYGGDGDDLLYGGAGEDLLDGGAGNDTLGGGTDADSFLFNLGTDWVNAFADNIDELWLEEDLWGGGLTVNQVLSTYGSISGGNAVLDFGSGNMVTVAGIGALGLLSDDIVLV